MIPSHKNINKKLKQIDRIRSIKILLLCILVLLIGLVLSNFFASPTNDIMEGLTDSAPMGFEKLASVPEDIKGLQDIRSASLNRFMYDGSYQISKDLFTVFDSGCEWHIRNGAINYAVPLATPLSLIYPIFFGQSDYDKLQDSSYSEISNNLVEPVEMTLQVDAGNNLITGRFNVSSTDNSEELYFYPLTFNASDFGFKSFQLNSAESSNVALGDEVVKRHITFMPLGCSSADKTDELLPMELLITHSMKPLKISEFPAKVSFDLWKEDLREPVDNPDMRIILFFE